MVGKNPLASPEQRYFYIETDPSHLEAILDSLKFRHPFSQDLSYSYLPNPMRSSDQAFWSTQRIFPSDMALDEYPVVENQSRYPGDLIINAPRNLESIVRIRNWRKDDTGDREGKMKAILNQFGYQLSKKDQGTNGLPSYSLSHGQDLLLNDIQSFGQIALSQSHRKFAIVAESQATGYWLIQNDRISQWNLDQERMTFLDPVFAGEDLVELIWDKALPKLKLIKVTSGELLFSRIAIYGASPPVYLFTQWDGHWLLEVDGVLFQDGINQNEILGYDEIFGWQLLNNQPVYFFRKGSKVGVNYAGQILPMQYDEVFHHGCCGYSFNPYAEQYKLQYYALHDGTWYYVEFGFPAN